MHPTPSEMFIITQTRLIKSRLEQIAAAVLRCGPTIHIEAETTGVHGFVFVHLKTEEQTDVILAFIQQFIHPRAHKRSLTESGRRVVEIIISPEDC